MYTCRELNSEPSWSSEETLSAVTSEPMVPEYENNKADWQ